MDKWLKAALVYPKVHLLNLTVPIVIQSTQIIGFYNDPTERLIVATAKFYDFSLLTVDSKILNYAGVETLK